MRRGLDPAAAAPPGRAVTGRMRQPFTFLLDWQPNVQFAGICWALDRGLYRSVGLDISVVPWTEDGRGIVQKVEEGGLCAGSAEDNLVVGAKARGEAQVSAVAAMFQQTPLVVMSRTETAIRSIGDLRGKRVAMHCDGIRILEGLLDLYGIGRDELDLVEVTHNLENLLERRFEAVQGYAVSEPHELEARGLSVSTFALHHPKLHPYAQVIFAPDTQLSSQRQPFDRFLQASFAGWRACLDDIEQAAISIRRVGAPMPDPERELAALRMVKRLVTGNDAGGRIGVIGKRRWADNIRSYRRFQIVPPDTPLDCGLDSSFWPRP